MNPIPINNEINPKLSSISIAVEKVNYVYKYIIIQSKYQPYNHQTSYLNRTRRVIKRKVFVIINCDGNFLLLTFKYRISLHDKIQAEFWNQCLTLLERGFRLKRFRLKKCEKKSWRVKSIPFNIPNIYVINYHKFIKWGSEN